jgi:hypothetical protein
MTILENNTVDPHFNEENIDHNTKKALKTPFNLINFFLGPSEISKLGT